MQRLLKNLSDEFIEFETIASSTSLLLNYRYHPLVSIKYIMTTYIKEILPCHQGVDYSDSLGLTVQDHEKPGS
jgi:hypothetical protein